VTLTIRPLATPHDPPSGTVTVATASCCCCCCCCCLASVGVVTGFTAGAAYQTAADNRRPSGLAVAMALLALPMAVLTFVVLATMVGDLQGVEGTQDELMSFAGVIAVGVYVGLAGGGLSVAGAGWERAVGVPVAVAVAAPVLFVAEVPLVFVTVGIVELTAPLTLWLGIVLGRRSQRTPPPAWPAVTAQPWGPVPPPPPAPPPSAPDLPALPPLDGDA